MANKIEKQFLDTENKGPVRLNKYLSESGVCSRREADKLIAAGQVTVDGVRAETGMRRAVAGCPDWEKAGIQTGRDDRACGQ